MAQNQQVAVVKDIQQEIMSDRMTNQLQMALPNHIAVEKFQRVVVTAINKTPGLLKADRGSLFTACVEAAQDGLLPNGKEAALVVFKTKVDNDWIEKVQYMPMIAGIYKRARNSGEVSLLNGHVVYSGDKFDYSYGFEISVEHKPALTNRGKPIGAYAVVVFKDGNRDLEFMSVEDIEKVRAVSKTGDKGPWVQWWDEMARKTVVKRLAKRAPFSSDIERMLARGDEDFDDVPTIEAPAAVPALERFETEQANVVVPPTPEKDPAKQRKKADAPKTTETAPPAQAAQPANPPSPAQPAGGAAPTQQQQPDGQQGDIF